MTDMPEPPIFIDGSEADPKEIYVFSDGVDKSISLRPNKYFVQYTRTDTIPQVKVKPLVWRNSYGVKRAVTPFGDYMITGKILTLPLPGRPQQVHPDEEAAIAFANSHYSAAILSAIEGEG